MAKGLNRIHLIGAVTQTPELRYTPGGLAILEVTVAGNDAVTDESGQTRELAFYHRVKLLGRYAEVMADAMQAGTPVFVDGRLEYRSWEVEGSRRSALDIRVDRIETLSTEGKSGELTVSDAKEQQRWRDGLNQVILIGNLTREPELRYTPQGAAVTRMGIAVNERFTTRKGEQEKTHFIDIQAWREMAEWAGGFAKGEAVFVIGRLVNDSWTTQTGERRYTTRVEAQRLERLTRGPGSGGSGSRKVQTSGVDVEEGLEEFPPEEDLPF